MNRFALIIILLAFGVSSNAQSLLPAEWKFRTGDDLTWAATEYNDANWTMISPDRVWEQQGYPAYDGFAWYRTSFVIPASSSKLAKKYDGFLLNLGKVDDADVTYFNGTEIGHNGGMPPDYYGKHDVDRSYIIPYNLIRWGKQNTIAVRVYDKSGNGGLYAGPPALIIKGIYEKIEIIPEFSQVDRIILGSPDFTVPLLLKNGIKRNISGNLSVKVTDAFGNNIYSKNNPVTLSKLGSTKADFQLKNVKPGFYKANVRLESGLFSRQVIFNFGYEPEKVIVKPDRQPDFENFWAKAREELRQVDPQYKVTKIDSLCTAGKDIYLVEMRSLGNVRIHGWYSVPKAPGKYPAIMQVPGYSSTILPSYVYYSEDVIGFGLNIRGHGNSCDDFNPGFPGYILYHLDNADDYVYKGAYMDCVRAVDFLFSRPEVDTTRVVVEGASQGGALTFATAALNNTRIKLCAPQVPFLSDFPDYFKVASWPANEFVNYVEVEKKQSWEQVFRTLSYFDIKNLAPWIKAPMIMGSGLCDEVCPSYINFAAYNNVLGEKSYVIFPLAGHSLPQEYYNVKMKWIREKLGLK